VGLWPYLALTGLAVVVFLAERVNRDLVTRIEEGILSILLAAITLVSFSQVVARYGFNSGWTGALELTRILFAWLILFGMSYGIKTNSHLGVDIFVRMLPKRVFRVAAIFGALICFLYGFTLLFSDWLQAFGANARGGAVAYWQRMFQLGIGLDGIRYPDWMQTAFGMQDRVQRWIAYLMLPIGLSLFAYRSLEAIIDIARGKREPIIASHEAEDLVAEHKDELKE
jgi:C4-dicarboxylate transporter DctQ subunit